VVLNKDVLCCADLPIKVASCTNFIRCMYMMYDKNLCLKPFDVQAMNYPE
jgi:hypothetical protein